MRTSKTFSVLFWVYGKRAVNTMNQIRIRNIKMNYWMM